MGLFQRKELAASSVPLYTIGNQTSVLIVGLGNPGQDYIGTRHNIGFACVEAFAASQQFPRWTAKKDLKSLVTINNIGGTRVVLVMPSTFMNFSGEAIQAVQHFYKIANSRTLVVHDELDIPFGQLRIKSGGGTAGHNGLKSIVSHIGDDFWRIRIGVRNDLLEKQDSADFVLSHFTKEEQDSLPVISREVNSLLGEFTAIQSLKPETIQLF